MPYELTKKVRFDVNALTLIVDESTVFTMSLLSFHYLQLDDAIVLKSY